MLLRLAYLGITNAFALLRLLPGTSATRTSRSSRYGISSRVLQRQLDGQQVRFEPVDRAWLAALCTRCHDRVCAAYGCWSVPTRSSRATAT
jgi:hypothetical protein